MPDNFCPNCHSELVVYDPDGDYHSDWFCRSCGFEFDDPLSEDDVSAAEESASMHPSAGEESE